MKRLLCLALVASLSACGDRVDLPPPSTPSTPIKAPAPTPAKPTLAERLAKAGPTIDAIQARYDTVNVFVDMLLPYLPPARQAQVRAAQAAVEKALAVARAAATLVEQRAAIETAKKAATTLEVVTDTPAPASTAPG